MAKLFNSRSFYIPLALGAILIIIIMALRLVDRNEEKLITTTVASGTVRELVSVSGIAEAEQTAELAFPTTGIVQTVNVEVGDVVETGDVLMSLNTSALEADRQDALASIQKAVADRDELIEGPTASAREVSSENIATRSEALQNTIETENQKVANAYRNLLSDGITAYSNDPDEEAVAPIITGTYSCEEEGTYILEAYSSDSNSGYSFKVSGLENGTYSASNDQPIAFGNCGIKAQFDSDSRYTRTTWIIDIPNKQSSRHILNLNAYDLALTQRDSAISAAEQALDLANANSNDKNAPARSQAVTRANANIAQAQARLAKINSTISDRILKAPFSGTITEIDILPGETVTSAPVITLLANNKFEITARIPEIDIGKLLIGQKVEMLFDANSDSLLTGEIRFISLKATEIDGVSYYEAIIDLDEAPKWLRSGLNADIEIIIAEANKSLRLPKRFITNAETGPEVIVQKNGTHGTTSIEVVFEGNDGYVVIFGLTEGDIIVAP
ncbi:MAG: RND family efflux transporter MFP subunit [Candidatus Paceibacteria bacterium]|jgi:RND family efflux transporter MFP subunit